MIVLSFGDVCFREIIYAISQLVIAQLPGVALQRIMILGGSIWSLAEYVP